MTFFQAWLCLCFLLNTGVEVGGALKNVLAIACGISDGLKFGNSARAALITRGERPGHKGVSQCQHGLTKVSVFTRTLAVYPTHHRIGDTLLQGLRMDTCRPDHTSHTPCHTVVFCAGLYELTKIAVAKGGNALTCSGLAGVGDLVLTW